VELQLWEIMMIFLAGAFITLIGGVSVGMLVYKTKYAGEEVFKKAEDHGGAEAFNLDQEFQEGDPKDYKPVEYPPEIVESVAGFEKAFGMDRLIKASQNVDQEVEDAA